MTVGSVCSGMPIRKRLTNTLATLPRSLDTPVSFSTIDASVSASLMLRSGVSGMRAAHAVSSRFVIARCARLSTAMSALPLL